MGQSEDLLLPLNDDVVFEKILPWLPPKSLLKFRSVSKSWYSAICHPDFIAKHQSHFGKNNCFISLLVLEKHSLKLRHIPEQQNQNLVVEDISLSEDFNEAFYKIMASCNGLFCYASYFNNDKPIYLCNPSIRWTRTVVPFRFSPENNAPIYIYGVGFDGRTNDYKVIMIADMSMIRHPPWAPIKAALYSVKANSWKPLNNVAGPSLYGDGASIFLHGFIHWLSYNKSTNWHKKILSFDVGNEVFGEIKLPVITTHYSDSTYRMSISAVRGSLCFLISALDGNIVRCHMWIMKEYGVVESWTKLVIEFKMEIHMRSLPPQELSTQATVGGKIMCEAKVMCVFSDFVRYYRSNLALFDPQTFEYKRVSQRQHSYIEAVSLVPSLQLLDITM